MSQTTRKQGAKVVSARLAKVLNLLTTSRTTRFCNVTEHEAKSGDQAENGKMKITAEV